ncbi:31077_t:CDS:2, partial [Racocetra persica]
KDIYGSKLLIRNCYLQLCELIEKDREQDGPAFIGCTITGTPVWQRNERNCYHFLPDGNVQKGDISLFDETLDNPNNFLIIDAQALELRYKAYMILLTSPRVERFNEALKWSGFTQYYMPVWYQEEIITLWDFQYKNKKNSKGEEFTFELVGELLGKWGPIPRSVLLKWDNVAYQRKYQQLINEVNLEDCINSIDKAGMPTGAISGRLVHLDPDPMFASAVYRFASPRVFDRIIQEYEIRTKRNARDLIMSSHEYPKIAGFRGNIFEDFAHRELQNGGTFRVRCLNDDNSEVNERNIKEMECNWFTTLNEAHEEYYNRPKSKIFASVDSFSLDSKTLDLYQMTVSTDHGIKIKGLNDLLAWRKDVNDFNLYFVVPPDIFKTFPTQKYKTAKDEDYQKIPRWINNITQYALEINLGISNKSAKKRSSDSMSGDYENEETTGGTNKDVKKRKMEESDAMLGDDEIGETSGSNVISGQLDLKRSSNVIDNESEDASKR